MKILHVITSLGLGGAQRLLSDIIPIQRQYHIVDLMVLQSVDSHFTRTLEESGVKIISIDSSSMRNPSAIAKMRPILKEYDIVHAHLFPTLYFVSIASIGLKCKLIYTEHSTSNKRRGKWYIRPIEQFIYSRYNAVISISQQTQEALKSWLRKEDNRFVVINNGVNVAAFSEIKRPVIPASLIMISRFTDSKDQETVIRAMQLVDHSITLRFVGDGETLEHCKMVANECGVLDRIEFLGARADVPELIASSYIGIQSSNWEGFGLTAVEIMASGKPVIATSVNGLKQVVEGAGILFQVGDVEELSRHINKLISDPSYYNDISQRCSQRAYEYDIQKMVQSYLKIYKECYDEYRI